MNDGDLLKNLKVLYVEDDADTRKQMQMILRKRVGKLISAVNGAEGLKKFDVEKPDVIITDSRMPVMDGLEMSRAIRSQGSDIPIIITTAFSEVEMILSAVDAGIEKYLLKPLDIKELLEALENTAVKALRQKVDGLVINESTLIDEEEKKGFEAAIQSAVAQFIKDKTGKGPRNVKVFMRDRFIEIQAFDTLTKMELTLLRSDNSQKMVEFSRENLYTNLEGEMERLIGQVIHSRCRLEKVTIDLKQQTDLLIFSYK